MDTRKLVLEQQRLAKKLILKFDADKPNLFGAVHTKVHAHVGHCMIVVCDTEHNVVEQQYHKAKISEPYVPQYRGFREASLIVDTWAKVKQKPEVVFFSGNGILHPQKMGLASQLGVLLDVCSIGVAKDISHGVLHGDVVKVENEKRAQLVQTKEHAKPIIVSPGHKITLKKAVDFTAMSMVNPHKLPEPLHIAQRMLKKNAKD